MTKEKQETLKKLKEKRDFLRTLEVIRNVINKSDKKVIN